MGTHPTIELVGNLWGYIIYWFFGDFIDLFMYFPRNAFVSGMREYFGANIQSPILAVWLLVGTFVDLRLFGLVVGFIVWSKIALFPWELQLRFLRAIDRLPIPFT